jgi:orotidine-5'-phosphate decarboxylase
VNSSRAILYAASDAQFADAARREALKTREVLQQAAAQAGIA